MSLDSQKPISPNSSITLIGSIQRVSYRDEESGFTIAKLASSEGEGVTLVGTLPDLVAGQSVQCAGQWRIHPVHGREFAVVHCSSTLPSERSAIQRYLQSGVIKGIGPKYAAMILDHFELQTFTIFEKEPQRLLEIPKFGKKRLQCVIESWQAQSRLREVMIFLQRFGIHRGFARKIYRAWGDQAIDKVRRDPYALARDVTGIGFKTADEIAAHLGFAASDDRRLLAGLEFTLDAQITEGHTCYPLADLLDKTSLLLSVDISALQRIAPLLVEQSRAVIAPLPHKGQSVPFIWPKGLYICEKGIAAELMRLFQTPSNIRKFDGQRAVSWAQDQFKVALAEQQKRAVRQTFLCKLHIVTGGPGTGKSTLTKIVVRLAKELGARIFLAAPTGRAAKRLAQVNSARASTLHQLLEFDFSKRGFKKDRQNPLQVDLMIVDEASMIDTWLFYSLLKALPSSANLLIIGDADQLPSVGPGNVLRDLIDSRSLTTTKLDEIFRQAQHSKIVQAAHAINRGIAPKERALRNDDFFLLPLEDPTRIAETVVGLVCKRLPERLDLDPHRDIQVLSAMRRGVIGIGNLNELLQSHLHPKGEPVFIGGRRFFLGDKVMQTRNNYRKEVSNGDIGRIVSLQSSSTKLRVQLLDERMIDYDFSELDELQHAYAVSVHKYQGSESPCIIFPIHLSHSVLLYRSLLYTAVTRGKILVILVGSQKALEYAVRKSGGRERFTALKGELLSAKIGGLCPI